MLIVGAGGFAKEVFEIFCQNDDMINISFYDDINHDYEDYLFNKFPILRNQTQVTNFFTEFGNDFTIGIGNPHLRYKLVSRFIKIGGNLISTISKKAIIGSHDVKIGNGCNILGNSIISNSVKIGTSAIIYYSTIITHDCVVGDYVELSPNVILLGNVKVGSFTKIGANSTILPNITIGHNVTIGAGSVVTKSLPDNVVAYGNPARIIRYVDSHIL